jgi:L-ascorbate metabolism protein UlaG (beta-lactamase superfamily)
MRIVRLFILAVACGFVVCGCKKQTAGPEPGETAGQQGARKEAAVGLTIQWLGHASFRICHGDTVIYIDPWKLKDSLHDATLVLVSHSHHDHYSPEDMAKVSGPDTKLIAAADVIAKENAGEAITSGLTVELDGVRLAGVAAYNPNKQFHPKTNNWVGFVIELGSKRLYYAGDTDLTEEMKALKGIDVALLPVGGTYTMDAAEAAEAAKYMKPGVAIPYHWGDIVGARADAEKFAKAAECDTKILTPGQTFNVK